MTQQSEEAARSYAVYPEKTGRAPGAEPGGAKGARIMLLLAGGVLAVAGGISIIFGLPSYGYPSHGPDFMALGASIAAIMTACIFWGIAAVIQLLRLILARLELT